MSVVFHLYKKYVRHTPKKGIVQIIQVYLCHLTSAVAKGIDAPCNKVYLSTRVVKHVYDKRPAEEFDFMLKSVPSIIKYPDRIYKNKGGKRGSYCLVKTISNYKCLVSLEVIEMEDEKTTHFEVATFFRTDDDYLASYELLWEWKGGTPSS